MSTTPPKSTSLEQGYKTPSKQRLAKTKTPKSKDARTVQDIRSNNSSPENSAEALKGPRKSSRLTSPNKRYMSDYLTGAAIRVNRKKMHPIEESSNEDSDEEVSDFVVDKPNVGDLRFLEEEEVQMAGKFVYGFNTPKKKGAMALAAMNTPKTPVTPKTPKTPNTMSKTLDSKRPKKSIEPKTPSHLRNKLKSQIAKIVENDTESDFSAGDTDYSPSESESSSIDSKNSESDNEADDEPKSPYKGRKPIVVPILPKTPSAARQRQASRNKKTGDYIPECETYFQSHSSSKILTSDHTLDRLKNPRLPVDRLFALLAEMKLSPEHETSINAMMEEYKSYFPKWLYILNEGYSIILYGLGSKRQLLQSFHRTMLSQQTVLVVNGFFPSLTIKDILDSITNDILDAGVSPSNQHEAVDMIEEEFALIPQTHLYLIVHNLEGSMLRNSKAQSVLSRLAKVPNIHLLASVDHINTPLLWDHTKLSNFNFSWWDCTTMLPYTDETAFENSLLVQNSGELALSSMRSVFLSLTTNSRGIYMVIVKHQLKNKGNSNYQGMAFKDLYSRCREAFLVSSDLALRAQLTEFLDHKLVKAKRSVDGSEQLTIPIDAGLLQQFLDEQEKN